MDMRILKFDIYQSTIAPNYLRVTKTLDTPISSKKKNVLSDVRSEIHLARCNIIFTGQSVRTFKNCIQACE